jgi:hypothetical protein
MQSFAVDPSRGSRRVLCTECGARGRVTELGSIFTSSVEWEVRWDPDDRCPRTPEGKHVPAPAPRT